jgi:iron complex outermembrane receptor protein
MKKTTIAGLIGLLFAEPALALETPIDADNVIVTASRIHENIQNIPANIQVISRDDINSLNPSSIPQILSQLGGLVVRGTSLGQFNLGTTIDMGGYGDAANSNTLILINGQRVSPIDSSSTAWEMIPIESIDRIEIIKGGAGVQYGNRASAGAINIITNEGAQNINRVSAGYGSFNTQTLNALVQNKLNDTLIKVSANTEHTNGWRQNSAATAYATNARLTQFFGENNVYIDISGSHNYAQAPGGVIGLVGQGNNQAAKFNNIGSFFEGENYGATIGNFIRLSPNATMESDLAYKKANLTYEEPFTPGNNNSYNRWSLTFSPRIKIDFSNLGNLVMGYDFSHAYGADRKLSNATLIDNSLYGMYRLPLTAGIELATGYRHQVENVKAHDGDSTNISPDASKTISANAWDAGLNYKFSQNEKVYVKYNQSFRFANIDEFWGWDWNAIYPRVFNGDTLTPQKDKTYQIGGDFLLGNSKITTSLFHTNTSHQIRYQAWDGININDPYLIERNGVYVSTSSQVNDQITIYTNANLQEVAYAEGPNKGQSVPLAPHLTLNARLNYKVNDRWSIGSVVNYVGSQYYNGAQDYYNNRSYPWNNISNPFNKLPSYTIADVYLNYKAERWDARVTIKNIANSQYATYGGIGFITIPGGNDNSYYYYSSDPRSVFASLSYNF